MGDVASLFFFEADLIGPGGGGRKIGMRKANNEDDTLGGVLSRDEVHT